MYRLPSPSIATPLGEDISGTALCATSTCQLPVVTTTAVGPASPGVGVAMSGALESITFWGTLAPKVGSATGVTSAPPGATGAAPPSGHTRTATTPRRTTTAAAATST